MGKNVSYYKSARLTGSIEKDIRFFTDIFINDALLRVRRISIAGRENACALIFMDGIASAALIGSDIIRAALCAKPGDDFTLSPENVVKYCLYSSEVRFCENADEMLSSVMYGDSVLLTDGYEKAVIINTKGWRYRGVAEPPNERVTSGPREGFDEAALLNVSQLRRKLQTPDLCVAQETLGRRTDTKVFICYLGSLADKKLVSAVREKIRKIDMDGVLDANYIAEKISDGHGLLFRTAGTTERPDIVAARLLEGRVAVIVDGSPVALTLPFLLSENFQSNEDYYVNASIGSAARILRFIGFFIACFASGIYVSLVSFHAGFLPTFSALAILKLRTGVPVSTLSECVALIFVLELLKEACSRAPRDTGTALGVVGGLVLGEAAINTETVSAPALIIVALGGLCSVMLPRLRGAILFLNLTSTFFAGFFGLFGVFCVFSVTFIYITGLRSFGADYTLSLKNPRLSGFKDVFIRASWKKMIARPAIAKDETRQRNED